MRVRACLIAIVLLAASAAGAAAASDAASPATRLRAFDDCTAFTEYARRQALPLVTAWGLGGGLGVPVGALPPAAARDAVAGARAKAEEDFSRTNVQEAGVDEPDIVKTDGRHVFAVTGNRLSAVDVTGGRPRLVGTLRLATGAGEVLLHGSRVLVLSQAAPKPVPVDGRAGIRAPGPIAARKSDRHARVCRISYRNPDR
jgi:uncharacterized secreted protein with C-terminal beta-propeller domain